MEAVKQKPKKLSLKSLKRKLSWAKYPSLSSSHLSKNYNNNNNHFHNGHPHYLNNNLCFCENTLHSSASSSAIVNFTLDQDLNNLNIHEASNRGKSILKNSKTFNRIASLQEQKPCACTNNNYNKVFNSNNIGCDNCHNQAPFMSISMTSSILMDSYGLVPNNNNDNSHINNNNKNQKLHQNTNGKYQNQLTVDNNSFHQKNLTPNKPLYINNHSKPYINDKPHSCSHCSINSSQQASSNYLHQQNYTHLPSYKNTHINDNNTNNSNIMYHNGHSQKVTNAVDTRLFPATPIKLRNKTCRSHLNDNHNYAIVDPKTKGIIHLAPSNDDSIKRYSLPANLNLPFSHLLKQNLSPLSDGQTNRRLHRESMYEMGFGKIESYTKLEKLGEGTYATVFKGKSHLTGGMVALKEIRLEHEEGAPCTAIREVSLLRDLKHINIVTLHDIIHTPLSLTLVFEYLDKDLKQYMDDCNNVLNMNNVKLFLFQVLRGLTYCHQRRILHRDLKPQNLLINHSGEVKLADFGLARAKSIPTKTYSNEVVTLWYRPPEILLGSTEYSTPIDMWGVGCILFEMSSGRPLSPGSSIEDQLNLIFKVLGYPTEYSWPGISSNTSFQSLHCPHYRANSLVSLVPRLEIEGHKLMKQLLNYDVKKRISSSEALHHDYFKSLGADVFKLADGDSIYKLPYITLQREPGNISVATNAAKKAKSGVKQWRQSVVF